MASEWSRTSVGDLLAAEGGEIKTGPFGTKLKAAEYSQNGGVPVVSVGEVGLGEIAVSEKTPRVGPDVTTRMPEYILRTGDIVFGRKGAVERSAIVKPHQDGWFLGSDGIRLRLPATCDARYVAYQFQLPTHRSWMIQHSTGSTMPSLNQHIVESIPLVLAPLSIQRRIADVLGKLDDKIELNRRMNRTLEKMAAAIFKSWFIDFDPVHAKAEGRDPGLPAELADLFPDGFEESELGATPRGWAVRPLTGVIAINPKRTLAKGALAPFLEMSNMPTRGPSPGAWRMRKMTSGTKFINGDTLLARITPCLENGKTAFVDFLVDGQVGWGSTEYIVLRPCDEIPPLFAYLLARTPSFRTFAIRQMTGSSGRQRVPPQSLSKYQLALPELDSPVYRALGHMVQPFFDRIKLAMMQNRRLAGLRDTLLPKLISGELSAKNISVGWRDYTHQQEEVS